MRKATPFFAFCRFFCRWACVLYFKTRAFGQRHIPDEGGALLVANHQSFMDPVLVCIALQRECQFMARDSLFRNKAFRWLIESLHAFPVRRGAADVGAIKETLRRLKQGKIVVMFPEGTRTPDGRIGSILPGLDAVARKANVPIVPVLIDGVYQAWPRNRAVPNPGDVVIEYDRPITPEDYGPLTSAQLTALIRERLLKMQQRWHGRVPSRRLK
jgi:1-acyl-sn-glycerol-3-phosphate acyltransferase